MDNITDLVTAYQNIDHDRDINSTINKINLYVQSISTRHNNDEPIIGATQELLCSTIDLINLITQENFPPTIATPDNISHIINDTINDKMLELISKYPCK